VNAPPATTTATVTGTSTATVTSVQYAVGCADHPIAWKHS